MPLPALIKNLDEVAEHFRSEYTQTDEGYTLQVDNADFTSKINEFRGNNISLQKELEEAKKVAEQFKGVDLEAYKKAMKTQEAIKEKQLLDAGELDKVIEQRTATMRNAYESQLQAITQDRDNLQGQTKQFKTQLNQIAVDNIITDAITKIAVPKRGAVEDIKLRAKNIWQVTDNGTIIPMNGDKIIYSQNGSAPMSPDEWITNLTKTAPYLFEPNQGGGGNGSGRQTPNQGKVVSRSEFSNNIEEIASGKKVLVD